MIETLHLDGLELDLEIENLHFALAPLILAFPTHELASERRWPGAPDLQFLDPSLKIHDSLGGQLGTVNQKTVNVLLLH